MRRTGSDWISFLWGLGIGLFLCSIIFIFGIYYITNIGIVVTVDAEEIAAKIRKEVEAQAKAQLPLVINEAKKNVPYLVAQEMTNKVGSASIQISNITIKLPDSAVHELESNLQGIVNSTVTKMLNQINTQVMSQNIGEKAYYMAKQTIKKEFDGKVIKIRVFRAWDIPVTLVIE